MSYRIYDTEAVVIMRWPQGEASQRIFLYTLDFGRILANAQGLRKVTAKLGPALTVGSLATVSLVCGKAGWRLVGASPQKNFLLSTHKYKRQAITNFSRILARLVVAEEKDTELYQNIRLGLFAIDESKDSSALKAIEKLLLFRTLVRLGYAPDPGTLQLKQFAYAYDYSDEVIDKFKPFSAMAVRQINRSMSATQL